MVENTELSEREVEILKLVATGASNKEIAKELFISTNTVKVHLRNIFTKTGSNSRTEAAMYAVSSGYVEGVQNGSGVRREEEPVSNAHSQVEKTWRVWGRGSYLFGGFIILLLFAGLIGGFYLIRRGTGNPTQAAETIEPTVWQARGRMPEGRSNFAAVAYEDMIYAIGGETESGATNLLERYNPEDDRWETLTSKPTGVSDISAVVIGGSIYVPGGKLSSGLPTQIMEVYNPIEESWRRGTNLPIAVSGYALAAFEGKIYLFGGWDGETYLITIYEYDPGTQTWTRLGNLVKPRAYAGAAVVGRKILIFGGYDGQAAIGEGEIFSPDVPGGEIEAWDTGEMMLTKRYGMGVAEVADIVYVIGGRGEGPEEFAPLAYFHQTNEWRSIPEPEFEIGFNLQLVSLGNYLYLLGGRQDGVASDQNYAYQAIYTVSVPIIINR